MEGRGGGKLRREAMEGGHGGRLEAPRGTQEPPRRHPGDTPEAPRASRRLEAALEAKCAKTIVFFQQKSRDRVFRLDGSDPTLTVCDIYCQKRANASAAGSSKEP